MDIFMVIQDGQTPSTYGLWFMVYGLWLGMRVQVGRHACGIKEGVWACWWVCGHVGKGDMGEGEDMSGKGERRSMRRSMRNVSGTHIPHASHSPQYNHREDLS